MDFVFAFPMKFAWVWATLTLAGLACLYASLRVLETHRKRRIEQFVSADLAPKLAVGNDTVRRRPLFWLTLFGFAFVAVALAQPHFGKAWREVRRQSRDIVVCLDVSPSMLANNPLPTRLDHAKQKIVGLTDRLPADRFALIAFAGAAKLQCPLTLDRGYFRAILKACDTDSISTRGTNIALAVEEAMKTFQEEEERSNGYGREHRAILIVTDGEQVAGDVLSVVERASETATVYVMGVGDPNGTEVEFPKMYARFAAEEGLPPKHVSKLDEDTLIKVATYGGGRYVRSQPDTWDLDQVVSHLSSQQARMVESDVRYQLVNRYQWPLLLAILCFSAEGFWLVCLPWLRVRREAQAAPNEEVQHAT